MSEFNEGDLVEAVKGETVIRGRAWREPGNGTEPILRLTLALSSDIAHLTANGYTVTVIEKAAPKLPTEPGVYVTPSGSQDYLDDYHTDHHEVHYLNTSGNWCDLGWGAPTRDDSLTRLEPVPVTARRVLGKLDAASMHEFKGRDSAHRAIYDDSWNAVAAEFGVTE